MTLKTNTFCKTNGAENLSKWLFRGADWLSQKQNFCADNSGSVLPVDIAEKKKRQDFLYLITGKSKPGRTQNHAVSVSENPETLWYPESSISSASTHLCYRLYCPWFDAKTLSELLGHADASITLNRYVHSSMQMKQEYVKRLQLTG